MTKSETRKSSVPWSAVCRRRAGSTGRPAIFASTPRTRLGIRHEAMTGLGSDEDANSIVVIQQPVMGRDIFPDDWKVLVPPFGRGKGERTRGNGVDEKAGSISFKIGDVVAELQRAYPDVTHSSLRFLEREGLVIPSRTPGGHRLYSQQDLGRIRQIKAWQAERLSLAEIRGRLAELEQIGSTGAVADRFLTTALAGDLARAESRVGVAFLDREEPARA